MEEVREAREIRQAREEEENESVTNERRRMTARSSRRMISCIGACKSVRIGVMGGHKCENRMKLLLWVTPEQS